METKYEPIKFDSWQELAKYVIDGGEVYYHEQQEIKCKRGIFNFELTDNVMDNLYTKKQTTPEELIKPRLCWVCYKNKKFTRLIVNVDEHGFFIDDNGCTYDNARLLTDDEIKQFLSGE